MAGCILIALGLAMLTLAHDRHCVFVRQIIRDHPEAELVDAMLLVTFCSLKSGPANYFPNCIEMRAQEAQVAFPRYKMLDDTVSHSLVFALSPNIAERHNLFIIEDNAQAH